MDNDGGGRSGGDSPGVSECDDDHGMTVAMIKGQSEKYKFLQGP